LPDGGGTHHEEQQGEGDEQPEPDQHDRDRAAAMQATPNHPDDGVECERQDDARRDAEQRIGPAADQTDDEQDREERATDGEQGDPVELERHSRAHPLDGLGQRWRDGCLWAVWFYCLVGFTGLGSHPRYCTRQ
jgi:hypothetical protein